MLKCDIDAKLSREEMECIEERWDSKMRCLATCLEALHRECAGDEGDCASLGGSIERSLYNNNTNNNNKKLVLNHKIQMQSQQRTPLSNCETRNETNVSSAYS